MGAGYEGAAVYAAAGLTMLDIGDEAIVDMGEFSLNGPGMKAVRQSVSRLQRRGYTARVQRHATLTDADFSAWARQLGSGAGTAVTSAASRWRWAGWPTRSTDSASWSRPGTATTGSAAS